MSEAKKREPAFDTFKGILIVLVVFGHAFFGYTDVEPVRMVVQTIYVFHMPAFVFVSGYFSRAEGNTAPGIIQLAISYILFNSAMMWFCLGVFGMRPMMLTPYYSTWYLLALIWWRLSLPFLSRCRYILVASVVVAVAVGFSDDIGNQFALARTFAFYPFFIAGYLFRQHMKRSTRRSVRVPQLVGIVILVAGVLLSALCVETLHITMNDECMFAYAGDLSDDAVRRIALMACAAITIVGLWIAMPKGEIPLLTLWGRNSLTIYLFHRFVSFGMLAAFPAESFSGVVVAGAVLSSVLVLFIFGSDKANTIYRQVLVKIYSQFARGGANEGSRRYGAGALVLMIALIAMWVIAMLVRATMS